MKRKAAFTRFFLLCIQYWTSLGTSAGKINAQAAGNYVNKQVLGQGKLRTMWPQQQIELTFSWFYTSNLFKFILYALAIFANIIIITSSQSNLHFGIDWFSCFLPAAQAFISGKNPYTDTLCYYNAPWLLFLFVPFTLLPGDIALALIWIIALLCVIWVAQKLGANFLTILALLLSPALGYDLFVTNINWLIAIGLILPAPIGQFLLLAKPQLGLIVALYLLVESWRKGGVKQVIAVLAPVTVAFLASFAIYGLRPLPGLGLKEAHWNMTMWPQSIPVGLLLTYAAIRYRRLEFAILASPFYAPYFGFHAWTFCLFGFAAMPEETFLAVAGLWGVILFRGGWQGM